MDVPRLQTRMAAQMKNPPSKNSRWKHKGTNQLHVVIFSDDDEVTTISANETWLGGISEFYNEFKAL